MEDNLRKHILKNVDRLIDCTDYKYLIHGCVQFQLLSQQMRRIIEGEYLDCVDGDENKLQYERHKRLFIKLTKRGPDAYDKLIALLRELEYETAVQILNEPFIKEEDFQSMNPQPRLPSKTKLENDGKSASKPKSSENDENKPLEVYKCEIDPATYKYKVKMSTTIHSDLKVPVYPMKSQHNRGVLFLVNIIDFPIEDRRNGSQQDSRAMVEIFHQMGFTVFFYENLTQQRFFRLLNEVITSEHANNAECFVMALMSHGNGLCNTDHVQFSDGAIIKVPAIQQCFSNHKCPSLTGKPKILIFPFCRGDVVDKGVYTKRMMRMQTDSIEIEKPELHRNIPSISDILICYASTYGFKSLRDPQTGSWYIQTFCEKIAQHAHDTSFEDIVKLIQHKVGTLSTIERGMQMPSYLNEGFNKKLYLNPGVYENNGQVCFV